MDGWIEERKEGRVDGWVVHAFDKTAKDLLPLISVGFLFSQCRALTTEGPKYNVLCCQRISLFLRSSSANSERNKARVFGPT